MRRDRAGESIMLPVEEIGKNETEKAIDEWVIGRNGERDRIIMRMHLVDGPSLEEMQKRLDKMNYPLSIDRIKKIILKREEQIAKHVSFN